MVTKIKMRKYFTFIVFTIALSHLVSAQSIHYVTVLGAGTKNGSSWADAGEMSHLQDIIWNSRSGDQVWVAKGTYIPQPTEDRSSSFSMKSGVSIYGGFEGTESALNQRNWVTNPTILSGEIGNPLIKSDNCKSVILNNNISSTAILDGFVIKDGYNAIAEGNAGGGIYNINSTPTIINCTITQNVGSFGGGIYNLFSSPTLINCITTFNSARSGGGIYNEGSSPTLINCKITFNTATEFGGGLYTANSGSTNSSPILTNCTIAGNSSLNYGGGIYSENENGSSPITINNSIIWGNVTSSDGNQFNINSGSITLNYCCYSNGAKDIRSGVVFNLSNVITTNPQFADAGANDYRITGSSPCKNAGSDALNSSLTDLRGQIRKNGNIDIGAYEWTTGDPLGGTAYIWTGSTDSDWNKAVNWNPSNIPTISDDALIPSSLTNYPTISGSAFCNELSIENGATLTITTTGALNVNDDLTNNGLIIMLSDASNTGSLIAASAGGTGTNTSQLYLNSERWHLISSPLSGQSVANFLSTNANIKTSGLNREMMDYDPASTSWNPFFTDGLTNGNLTGGKGFGMRTSASGVVTFSGLIKAGAVPVSTVSNQWNCVGNPYSSSIAIVSGNGIASDFLTSNSSNLDPNYGAIYIYDPENTSTNISGQYIAVSNASIPYDVIQQGQAFMIKMKTNVSFISFNQAMQAHNNSAQLKSTKGIWPTIKLVATSNGIKSSTIVTFSKEMTNGLDQTYDAGQFLEDTELSIYTRLVDDNGIPFAIQALPENYSNLIIPVGIESKVGGEVVFSSETFNLPENCMVILEDKLSKTYTDLSKSVYSANIEANATSNRFQLHTSYLTTNSDKKSFDSLLSAYLLKDHKLKINGDVSDQAIATLYDIQGRVIIIKNLEEGNGNIIDIPNLITGIYVLLIKDNGKVNSFKIPIKE